MKNIYIVKKEYRTNYPNPINLSKNEKVKLGEKYNGPEKWDNWIYCYSINNKLEGWVPSQIIEQVGELGIITESYTAKELNIMIGDKIILERELNGWAWGRLIHTGEEGWVPCDYLSPYNES